MNEEEVYLEVLLKEVLGLRDELRLARTNGLVVRLPDAQVEDIAYRVLERIDERLASQPPPPDSAPQQRQKRRLGR